MIERSLWPSNPWGLSVPRGILSLPATELHRSGGTLRRVAIALGCSVQAVSMQFAGQRPIDPRLPAVIAAITDQDTARRVLQAIPDSGGPS